MIRDGLPAAAILIGGYAAVLAALFVAVLFRSRRLRRERERSAAVLPRIREALVDYLAGSNDLALLRQFAGESPREVAAVILEFQGTAGGGALDRLCQAALELKLVHAWCEEARSRDVERRRLAHARLAFVCAFEPCRRQAGELLLGSLKDPDADVRLSAARGLVQSGEPEDIEQVFDLAISGSPLIRILLAEDLRRHCAALCEYAIPQVLASGDSGRILVTLDLLAGWERALPLAGVDDLLANSDREIRIRALRLAPFVPVSAATAAALTRALEGDDVELRIAAAQAAGRLKMAGAAPALALCLRRGAPELARAAAGALAEIGPPGWVTLVELSSNPHPVAADAAREALGRVKQASA
jgi:HEAT repeat protein